MGTMSARRFLWAGSIGGLCFAACSVDLEPLRQKPLAVDPGCDGGLPDAGPRPDAPSFITPTCAVPAKAPSGGACYSFASCNPMTNQGCSSGSCDFSGPGADGRPIFSCVPGGGSRTCESCLSTDCAPGHGCVPKLPEAVDLVEADLRCIRYCCFDADCCPGRCIDYFEDGVRFCIDDFR
jgi:hypothetical protein